MNIVVIIVTIGEKRMSLMWFMNMRLQCKLYICFVIKNRSNRDKITVWTIYAQFDRWGAPRRLIGFWILNGYLFHNMKTIGAKVFQLCKSHDNWRTVPFFGRHSSKIYISNKPICFGFNSWVASSDGNMICCMPYPSSQVLYSIEIELTELTWSSVC